MTEEQHVGSQQAEVLIPPPVEGGSYSVESLGRWVDNLLGDRRAHNRAAKALQPLLALHGQSESVARTVPPDSTPTIASRPNEVSD